MTTLFYDYFNHIICFVLSLIANKKVVFSVSWGVIHFKLSTSSGKCCRQKPDSLYLEESTFHAEHSQQTNSLSLCEITHHNPSQFLSLQPLHISFQENYPFAFSSSHLNNPLFPFPFLLPSYRRKHRGRMFLLFAWLVILLFSFPQLMPVISSLGQKQTPSVPKYKLEVPCN